MQYSPKKYEKKFCLYKNDFGIKYPSTDYADHIINSLQEKYSITTDWEGKNFWGLTLDCNYEAGYADMEMSGYTLNELNRLQHTSKVSPQYSPHHPTGFKYFTPVKWQYSKELDEKSNLSKQDTTFMKYIAGSFYYYGRSLDGTIITALN